jgi:hypothetical protein
MRKGLLCVSLAALLAGGCNVVQGGGDQNGVKTEVKNVGPQELQAAVTDPRVKRFYQARNWAPVWDEKLAGALTGAFGDANRHALQGAAFIREVKQGSTPAEREAALTLNAIEYAQALANGAVDPRKVFDPYSVPLSQVDVVGALGQAVQKGNVREWLASLAPQDDEYRALSNAYVRYAQAATGPKRDPISRSLGYQKRALQHQTWRHLPSQKTARCRPELRSLFLKGRRPRGLRHSRPLLQAPVSNSSSGPAQSRKCSAPN